MEEQEDDSPGIPAWVMTFADLMSLLMCFFVLLLSFSEIDAQKFKQIAGELSKAFGVQRDIAALDIPMGTSPIFDKKLSVHDRDAPIALGGELFALLVAIAKKAEMFAQRDCLSCVR